MLVGHGGYSNIQYGQVRNVNAPANKWLKRDVEEIVHAGLLGPVYFSWRLQHPLLSERQSVRSENRTPLEHQHQKRLPSLLRDIAMT